MLQEGVNELKSGILEIDGDIVKVTGFTREEMLHRHLKSGSQCFSSKGLYTYQNLEFHNIQNNALIIVRKKENELSRHQFKPIHKETIQYKEFKDGVEKTFSLTFTIRKSTYSEHFHLLSEKLSELFDCKEKLDQYLQEKFNIRCSY